MMEELKLIIEAIAGLPTIMVWVLLGYLVYKLAVVGSVYGLLRFGIEKMHDVAVEKRKPPPVEIGILLDGINFDSESTKTALLMQLNRLRFIGKATEAPSYSIHKDYGVRKLREAIDIMVERDSTK